MEKDNITVEFVAVKNPRGRVIKARKNGSLIVRYEMLQQELDAMVERMCEEHLEKEAQHEQV